VGGGERGSAGGCGCGHGAVAIGGGGGCRGGGLSARPGAGRGVEPVTDKEGPGKNPGLVAPMGPLKTAPPCPLSGSTRAIPLKSR